MKNCQITTIAFLMLLSGTILPRTAEAQNLITIVNTTDLPAEVILTSIANPSQEYFQGIIQPRGQLGVNVPQGYKYTCSNSIAARAGFGTQQETVQLRSALNGNPRNQRLLTFNNRSQLEVAIHYYTDYQQNQKVAKGVIAPGKSFQRIAQDGQMWGWSYTKKLGLSTFKVSAANTMINIQETANPKPVPANNTKLTIQQLFLKKLNEYRVSKGRSTLKLHDYVSSEVQQHTREMAARYNGRNQNDHIGGQQRAERIGKNVPGALPLAENVATPFNGTDEAIVNSAMEAWKISKAGHNENMLNPQHTHVGVGVTKKDNAVYVSHFFVRIAQ